jgi:hypothetical protein
MEYALIYLGDDEVKLQGYSDSDWAANATDKNNTSRWCFSLGLSMISWFNRKQTYVALSLAEEKYMVANTASCEAIWLWKSLS